MKVKRNRQKLLRFLKINPIAVSVLLSLPVVTQAANLSMQSGKISLKNGVPVIDINKANDKGVSHNIYDKLNVDKKGLIFNNSQSSVNTVLAGEIKGTSKLTSGTAKIILNEVISTNKSTLNGKMEVAGDKAHLIIVNPNGISCQGCGFINTEKVTITTGKPQLQNGEIKGYSVNQGIINLGHLENESPTEVLARFVTVNADVNAKELTVIAGNNYIDSDGNVTGKVKAQGSQNAYGIDVYKIGGMYADRIKLISTESGVGVRNAGVLAGGASGIHIDSKGKLVNNNGQIKSGSVISVVTKGTLDNIYGNIKGAGSIFIDTNKNKVNNSRAGNISATDSIFIDSGELNNTSGKIAASRLLAVNTHDKALINYGKGKRVGIEAGTVSLKTGTLNNRNGQIKALSAGVEAANINNTHGTIEIYDSVNLLSKGEVNNSSGLIRSSTGYVKIDAAKGAVKNGSTKSADTVSNDSLGIIAGEGGIEINAATVNNRAGQIASSGNISLSSSGMVDSYQGKLLSNKSIFIKAGSLNNSQGGFSGKLGINAELQKEFNNYIGMTLSGGNVAIKANLITNSGGLLIGNGIELTAKDKVDNSWGLIRSHGNLKVKAGAALDNQHGDEFGKKYGIYLGMGDQPGGMVAKESIDINTDSMNNNYSRIIAENGTLNVTVKERLSNYEALLVGGKGDNNLKSSYLDSRYSTIYAKGKLRINADYLYNNSTGSFANNNAAGIISSDGNMMLNLGKSFDNKGWISSSGDTVINVKGNFYNSKEINSNKSMNITATDDIYNYNNINAKENLNVNSGSNFSTAVNSYAAGKVTTVNTVNDIINRGTIFGTGRLSVASGGNIFNYNYLLSYGFSSIRAKSVNNNGSESVLGGYRGLELNAQKVSGNDIFVGL